MIAKIDSSESIASLILLLDIKIKEIRQEGAKEDPAESHAYTEKVRQA